MIQRGEHFGVALEACHALRVASKSLGQNFDCHIALQLGIARAVDLSHATGADGREDFEVTEFVTHGKRHM